MTQLVQLLNEFGGWMVRHLGRLSLELVVLAAVVFVVIGAGPHGGGDLTLKHPYDGRVVWQASQHAAQQE